MSCLRTSFLILLGAFLLGLPVLAQTAPIQPIQSLPGGQTYEIGPGEKGVRIPLALHVQIRFEDLDPAVVVADAARGTIHNETVRGFFKPVLRDGALFIDISQAPLQAGTYDLKLEVRLRQTRKGFNNPQILDLHVVQPAAQLQPPGKLVIEQSVGPGGRLDVPKLELREISGRSDLTGVTIRQSGRVEGAGDAGTPAVEWEILPSLIHGKPVWVSTTLKDPDGLSVGTVSGTAEVSAPQLAAPVPFTFEIKTRQTAWWIFLFAILGLVGGYLLRTLLPRWVGRDQARLQAVDLLGRIDQEMGRRKDPDFENTVKAIRSKLETATKNGKISAEDLGKEVNAAVEALNQQVAALEARLVGMRGETGSLARLVETGWFLPAEISATLSLAKPGLTDARKALLESNAAEADEELGKARTALAGLTQEIESWQASMEGLLQTLESASSTQSPLKTGFEKSVQRVRALLVEVPDPGVEPGFEALVRTVEGIDRVRRNARRLLLELRARLEALLAGKEGAREQLEALRIAAAVPESAGEAVKKALSMLKASGEGRLYGDLGDDKKASSWAGIQLERPAWAGPGETLNLSPGFIKAARLRIEQELWRVTALRTGLVWVGLLGLGYLLYQDRPGTLQDFAEVFFWGFGTDVTVDAFWNAAKGYKKG